MFNCHWPDALVTDKRLQVSSHSGISNSGHSEIRTASLQRTQLEAPKYFLLISTCSTFLNLQREYPHYEQEDSEISEYRVLSLKYPIFRDFTVYMLVVHFLYICRS